MTVSANIWSIVLAAGQGSRLRSLTADERGVSVPKQFCSLCGGSSLLRDALRRAEAVTPRGRVCAVVAEQHGCWWGRDLSDLPDANIIVQPANRGTANGILLPLLHIAKRDPDATIVLLPSDHHVQDECTLASALQAAAHQIDARHDRIVLLGISPDEADPELGYIVPGADVDRGMRTVARFVEKPSAPAAQELIRRGALWNSFILTAAARTLLDLFERKIPNIVAGMRRALRRDGYVSNGARAIASEYAGMRDTDFSRQIISDAEALLRVVTVPACGWSDLGTPRRVAATLRRLPGFEPRGAEFLEAATGIPCLAARHARRSAHVM